MSRPNFVLLVVPNSSYIAELNDIFHVATRGLDVATVLAKDYARLLTQSCIEMPFATFFWHVDAPSVRPMNTFELGMRDVGRTASDIFEEIRVLAKVADAEHPMAWRGITTHIVPGATEHWKVSALEPAISEAKGFVPTTYAITFDGNFRRIIFQSGNPAVELNGVTNEALLALVEDRLRKFQLTPNACPENEQAANLLVGALEILKSRTRARVLRGVHGLRVP